MGWRPSSWSNPEGTRARVRGIDAAPALVEIAQRRVPGGEFRVGELEYPDGGFDLVTGFNAFQYAASPVDALRDAKRVTRSGGAVVVMVWRAARSAGRTARTGWSARSTT